MIMDRLMQISDAFPELECPPAGPLVIEAWRSLTDDIMGNDYSKLALISKSSGKQGGNTRLIKGR